VDTALVTLLINLGWGGIILVLLVGGQLVTGREHKRLEGDYDRSQQALQIERQRNAEMLVWAATGSRAMQAVAQVAQERAQPPPPPAEENPC